VVVLDDEVFGDQILDVICY